MKTLYITAIVLLFSLNNRAQNKNVQETTKTTTTTVTNSEGDKTFIKKENVRETQNIELEKEKPNTLNIETKDSPVMSTTTTKVTSPDGSVRTVGINKSSYYLSNGNKYLMTQDASGYTITYGKRRPALLRKTTTNNYIYISKNKTSIGHFDSNGNLVLETYDTKSDKIMTETYVIVKE